MQTTQPLGRAGRVRVEQGAKRVRAYLGGELVADTTRPRLVWEVPSYPAYYFPVADVRTELLVPSATVSHSPSRGQAQHATVKAGDRIATDAARRYADSPIPELRDLIRLDWDAMEGWFEEDEEVYTHPRDPYTRVDILASSRRVRVELEGVVLADSTNARVLFETGLPPRWYLPKTDLRMHLLVPTDTVTHCPYKGQAQYWSVRLGDRLVQDLAWSYRTTLPESQKIAGLVAFYNEEVDLYIDGQLQQRPLTKFSRKTKQTPSRIGIGRPRQEVEHDYGDGRVYRSVSIAELHDGKAYRVTDYWGEPFTPPQWRETLAGRLDVPRDGVWPAVDLLQAD